MHRGLVHVLAWLLATGAAVTLSWWGVHTVMSGTAYDPPRALPISAGGATAGASAEVGSATSTPAPSPSPEESGGERTSAPPSPSPSPSRSAPASAPAPAGSVPAPAPPDSGRVAGQAAGQVESYDTGGGRAVFSLGEASAALVSATPAAGWSMQVWKTETWIRVEFASGADRVSVFCTWHDSAPRVEVNDY
ncbi:hypothetical protein GCM10010145_25400 [Streptomyces ruber]|uniref:Secreted protein n=2 Tax=Streptomyces TaxID=1883 RepID=A0A918EQ22_9ACTN|nr:hypothetical protein [Streptomyces ruber]GGQ54754.1 hypothetical protein GCM10010145_25400 [Streptomyces ruber]